MGLITVDYFTALPLGIRSSSMPSTDTIQSLIDVASEQVERYCDRYFLGGAYSDYVPGMDKMKLVLENYPVKSLTAVTYWDELDMTGTVDVVNKLRLYPTKGIVEWVNYADGPFMRGRTYQVDYSAGYVTVPLAVQHATALWTAELLQPNFAGPMDRVPALIPFSSQQIVELLEPYRRRRIG